MRTIDEALHLAVHYHQAGELGQAEGLYRQILQVAPRHAGALHFLGVIAHERGRHDRAIAHIRQAIAIEPRQAMFHNNLGEARARFGQLDEAILSFSEALRLEPDLIAAHNNLGLALQATGEVSRAVDCFQQALRIRPDDVDANYNYSRVLLLQGDYERGWPQYAWHTRIPGHPSQAFAVPAWDGSPLKEKRLLLYSEQGQGDTLQFIRYAPRVRSRVARLTIEVQPTLVPLLAQSGYEVVARGSCASECDLHASLFSLPELFRTTLATVPADVPYVRADPRLVDRWRAALAGVEGRKIGIAWQGNPVFRGDCLRSIPLAEFAPLAGVPGIRLISLQKADGTEQLEPIANRFRVLRLDPSLDTDEGPFMDTAAIMKHLDLVITSDTAIAHLAGALGVRVWVALPIGPDWRWMLERSDCPWYPTMRLFRQSRRGVWSDVFGRMADELSKGIS